MQRLPLTDSRLAAALMAVGVERRMFRVEPLHNTKTGQKRTSWQVDSPNIAEIRDLIAEADPSHKNALERSDPNHPFLAALAGIENFTILTRWLERPGIDVCCRRATEFSGILKLYMDNFASPFTFESPKAGMQNVAYAAALVAAGFPLFPKINEGGVFGFPDVSVTIPPITAAQCVAAGNILADPRAIALPELPGYPPGKHPFCYAFSACLNLRLLAPAEDEAWKVPTRFFPGRGARCAVATDAALRKRGFEDQLRSHINGF